MARFYVAADYTNNGQVRGYIATDDSTQDKRFSSASEAHAWADARNAGLPGIPMAGDRIKYLFHDSRGNDVELEGDIMRASYHYWSGRVIWHIYVGELGNHGIGIHNIREIKCK